MKLNLPEISGQRYKTKTSELFSLKGEDADTFTVSSGVVGWASHVGQWERTCLPYMRLKRCSFTLWTGKSPWRRKWQPIPVLLPGKFHGQRSVTLYRRQWSRPFPRKRKAKWLSEKALQIAVKRREVKGKGEKERYTHLDAEFQRIARRDKKAFLSDQGKEIEENNRMGKTRDLFKKLEIPREHFMQRWAR